MLGRLAGVAISIASLSLSASTDWPPAEWRPACEGHWYTTGYTKRMYVIHDMEGYYESGRSYLQGCGISVSIHYMVNGKPDGSAGLPGGECAQNVRDAYYGWHARCWNKYSMGTEHEGFASSPAWYTPAMFTTSSSITSAKATKYGFAKDRNHIVAHGQKSVAGWPAWASANLGIDPNCNDHTDPGPYWNWTDYMARVTGGGGSTPVNNAAVVSASVPATVGAGKTFTASVTMNNNGTKAWTTDATAHALGSQDPQDNTRWGMGRIGLPGTINPGQNATFSATFTAPSAPGSYSFSWKMVEDGVQWFGATYSTTINVVQQNGASVVSITAPTSVAVGATFSATVVMNNSGSKPWTVDANPHALGSQNPQDNGRWGLSRVGIPATINPGQNATFTFNCTAPTTAGTYPFDWKMLEEGIEWFGAMAAASINVTLPAPAAPSGLSATAVAFDRINLAWTDNSGNESGFRVERSTDNVNFAQFISVGDGVTTTSDAGLTTGTTYYYRVRAYNAYGNSAYSATASATTPVRPPELGVIGGQTGTEGQALTFTASSSNPNQLVNTTTIATWEGNSHGDAEVMFRLPVYSGSTSGFIDTTQTNYTIVATGAPSGVGGTKALKTGWSFKTGQTDQWVRFLTFNAPSFANPTIGLDQVCTLRVHASKAIKVGLAVRESGSVAAYGANGGTTGTIEWAGVTNTVSGNPVPDHAVAANTWTTLTFNIPFEAQRAFTGDGKVDQSGVKGVLEHLAFRGEGGSGAYTVYLDDIAVVEQNTLVYSLDAGAPSGASIERRTGKFAWTPTTGQAGNYNVTVRVTDRLGQTDFETIAVHIVSAGNHPPVLAAIGNKAVNEGAALTFTATASDQDAGQTKTFSLDAGAPSGASIHGSSGAFTWTPSEAQGPGSYPITVRVTDNGAPASNDFETITVTVNEVNVAPVLAAIASQTINEGQTLAATASATDADVPANSLTYSLADGAPAGMTINASSGAISWVTGENEGPLVASVTAVVTDGGGLSDSKSFTATVNELNQAPSLTVPTAVSTTESITDMEGYEDTSYNGTVLFRQPSFSSTTSAFIDTATNNYTYIRTSFPAGNQSTKVLQAAFSIKTGTTNPWLRLGTYNTASVPNPTLRTTERVRMDVYVDRSVKLGLIVRETGTSAQVGQNGGVTGPLEYVGVSSLTGSMPNPTRTITAGAWTTVEFNLPSEAVTAFTGDGVLSSATGKAVLDSLAVVPNAGTGLYNLYLDNVQVVTVKNNYTVDTGSTLAINTISSADADFPAQTLTYSLDAGAPAGAAIQGSTGVFTWTPTAAQGPSTNVITIRVTDNGPGSLSAAQNITVVVNKVNTAPRVTSVYDGAVEINGGAAINLTITATDDDVPTNTLTFSLQGSVPSGAGINASSGVFTWSPPNVLSTNVITVRVTDNGVPPLYDEKDMTIVVTPTNTAPSLSLGVARITEKVVNYESFANNTANGTVMFRQPVFSGSTSAFLDTAVTNYTRVTTSFPAGNANAGAKVLVAGWTFKTGTTSPYLRLLTSATANVPNPTIDLTARVKFDLYTAGKAVKVGLGVRETGGTGAIGSDGGTTGGIEWLGVTKVGSSPDPSRTVNADVWTTVEFNLPAEGCTNFSSGNSVLAVGKGVLEHLAIVPASGMGAYTIYVDNFEVVWTPAMPSNVNMNANASLTFTASATDPDPGAGLSYGLDADAPATATIDSGTGAFSWTPTAAATATISVFAEDDPTNGALSKKGTQTFLVNVASDPLGVQGGSGESAVAAGETVALSFITVAGAVYQLQVKANPDAAWVNAGATVTGDGNPASLSFTNEDGGEQICRVVEAGGAASE